MKYLIVLAFLLVSCAHQPKYKVGDCVDMEGMLVDEQLNWHSSGKALGEFQILDIVHTTKQNKWMNERLHSDYVYVMKDIDWYEPFRQKELVIIPVSDLDNFRYASVFWELPENKKWNCNSYSTPKVIGKK